MILEAGPLTLVIVLIKYCFTCTYSGGSSGSVAARHPSPSISNTVLHDCNRVGACECGDTIQLYRMCT